MTYVLNPSEQLAQKIEAKAAEQGIAPEVWFLRVAEKEVVQETTSEPAQSTNYASDEAFAKAQAKVFDQYAKTFDALAEGAK